MLVEKDIFDTVDVYFLIVGHTHASIDQYFSVLARQILSSDFIGSPLSLQSLLGREKDYNLSGDGWKQTDPNAKPRREKPLLIRKLSVIFDLKSCLVGIIDMDIKFYSIPHRFQFKKFLGVTAMQYTIYSTQEMMLPPRPTTTALRSERIVVLHYHNNSFKPDLILFCYFVRI
jgi:hypothetical protein